MNKNSLNNLYLILSLQITEFLILLGLAFMNKIYVLILIEKMNFIIYFI